MGSTQHDKFNSNGASSALLPFEMGVAGWKVVRAAGGGSGRVRMRPTDLAGGLGVHSSGGRGRGRGGGPVCLCTRPCWVSTN